MKILKRNLKDMAANMAKRPKALKGGASEGKSTKDYTPEEQKAIKVGAKEELEHTDNKSVAEEIAKDHVELHGKMYYHELHKLEQKLKKRG